jgi:hypothetical protein
MLSWYCGACATTLQASLPCLRAPCLLPTCLPVSYGSVQAAYVPVLSGLPCPALFISPSAGPGGRGGGQQLRAQAAAEDLQIPGQARRAAGGGTSAVLAAQVCSTHVGRAVPLPLPHTRCLTSAMTRASRAHASSLCLQTHSSWPEMRVCACCPFPAPPPGCRAAAAGRSR